jgi:hypothetical protein
MNRHYRTLSLLVTLLSGTAATSALAAGVDYAHIESDPVVAGGSNIIHVYQNKYVDSDEYYFADVTTNAAADHVWFGSKVEARCSSNFRLDQARLVTGLTMFSWTDTPFEVIDPQFDAELAIPLNTDNRTLPWRHVDFDVPLTVVESHLFPLAGTDFLQAGENHVAEQVALGADEDDIRSAGFTLQYLMPVSFEIACRRYAFGDGIKSGGEDALLPLSVVYEPKPSLLTPPEHDPGTDQQIDPRYSGKLQVTQAELFVFADEASCSLDLSAVFTSTDETIIQYRLLNELNQKTPLFQVPVDNTHTAFVHHTVDLSATADDGGLGLTAPEDHGGAIDDLADADSDHTQGYFQIEVTSPHHKLSNIASYHMNCADDLPPLSRN